MGDGPDGVGALVRGDPVESGWVGFGGMGEGAGSIKDMEHGVIFF